MFELLLEGFQSVLHLECLLSWRDRQRPEDLQVGAVGKLILLELRSKWVRKAEEQSVAARTAGHRLAQWNGVADTEPLGFWACVVVGGDSRELYPPVVVPHPQEQKLVSMPFALDGSGSGRHVGPQRSLWSRRDDRNTEVSQSIGNRAPIETTVFEAVSPKEALQVLL